MQISNYKSWLCRYGASIYLIESRALFLLFHHHTPRPTAVAVTIPAPKHVKEYRPTPRFTAIVVIRPLASSLKTTDDRLKLELQQGDDKLEEINSHRTHSLIGVRYLHSLASSRNL